MNLEITCKGIKDTSINLDGTMDITLQDVQSDFIEQIPAREIVMYANNKDLLNTMDCQDIIDYLESNYDFKVVDTSGGVE